MPLVTGPAEHFFTAPEPHCKRFGAPEFRRFQTRVCGLDVWKTLPFCRFDARLETQSAVTHLLLLDTCEFIGQHENASAGHSD